MILLRVFIAMGIDVDEEDTDHGDGSVAAPVLGPTDEEDTDHAHGSLICYCLFSNVHRYACIVMRSS